MLQVLLLVSLLCNDGPTYGLQDRHRLVRCKRRKEAHAVNHPQGTEKAYMSTNPAGSRD
jgi:hypothetical protein